MTRMREDFLPFALPDLGETELAMLREVVESGWITTGAKTRQFETEFARFVGAKHAIAVNSCTAAMHLALDAVGLRRGDVVLTTPYTFAATAEVIRYFDALPVFVDIEAESLNIDPGKLVKVAESLCVGKGELPPVLKRLQNFSSGQLKAIIPVHLAGLAVDLDRIYALGREHRLAVIEDAAHAFPSRFKGQMIGSSSDFSCFSFYATKTITTGEGGMICTGNDAWAERCRIMALHGISKDAWKRYTAEGSWYYEIIAPGYKYNMTDLAAALGLAQLGKANIMWQRRFHIAQRYNSAFAGRDELQVPAAPAGSQHAWHLYVLRLHLEWLKIDRGQFIEELKARGIGCSVHFIPLHLHPYYRETYGYQPEDFPVAYQQYQRAISLPIYSKMTDRDVQDVIDAVLDIVESFRC